MNRTTWAATGVMALSLALASCDNTKRPVEPVPDSGEAPQPPATTPAANAPSADGVFEQRIAPIFKSSKPSSCAQCHLAAVDLKDYILPSARDTFLALRDQGLIDMEKPENSKILRLINRGENEKYGANLIPPDQRQAEYDAFAAWIKACAADPALKSAPKPQKAPVLATKPVEVVRHARKDRMAESFEDNVWAMRFRCMNCHTEGTPQNDKLRNEHGDRVAWFKKGGPAATMEYLLSSTLINLDEPEKSLLLTKPLGTVKHGGGIKFAMGDQGYKAMRAWIDDVVAIKKGKYATAADLPAKGPNRKQFGTEIWLKITNAPQAWSGKLLQVDVYGWDADVGKWEKDPVATSDRLIGGKGGIWHHTLTLLADADSRRAKAWSSGKPSLPQGKYLVKVYVDRTERVQKDWKAALGAEEFVGQVELQSRWPEGYGSMTVADGTKIMK